MEAHRGKITATTEDEKSLSNFDNSIAIRGGRVSSFVRAEVVDRFSFSLSFVGLCAEDEHGLCGKKGGRRRKSRWILLSAESHFLSHQEWIPGRSLI